MEGSQSKQATYHALLEYIRQLFTRDNLCSNTYLFKHMRTPLILPLHALAEERRIASLTRDQTLLLKALTECGYLRLHSPKELAVIDYPTVKISSRSRQILNQLDLALRQQQRYYSFTERIEQEFINLTLYEEDEGFLEKLIPSVSKELQFEKVGLYQDMRIGTAHIKKIKLQQKGSGYGKLKFSADKPPQIFIRRAVDSDEEEDKPRAKQGQRRKKYKQASKDQREPHKEEVAKPQFNSEDFPTLS